MSRTYSLRRRLVLILVLVVGMLWIGAALLAFRTAHHEADEMFDAQMVQMAETLLTIVAAGEVEDVVEEMNEHALRYELPLHFQVWARHDGRERLVLRSPQTSTVAMATRTGFVERSYEGSWWRFFGASDRKGTLFVVVGQEHDARYTLATELALHLLLPVGVGLPLMAVAVWWVVGLALRPLDETAQAVGGLSPEALKPIGGDARMPREVAPLVEAIDRLIGRVDHALENERRFTADAAHELRTPLAALKIQAQVAARTEDPQARQRALAQVLTAVDRMTHLVEQLLTLARLDPTVAGRDFASVDLKDLIEVVSARLAPSALARHQHLALDTDQVTVEGNGVWLDVLVRNLVDNALRYTPDEGRIEVCLHADGDSARITVSDSGPGLSAEALRTVRGRFARGEGNTADGVGLGLSIIERVVELHGGSLRFEPGLAWPGGHGLTVVVDLPLHHRAGVTR
jgi:two-component system sensor histidine kinase QseC